MELALEIIEGPGAGRRAPLRDPVVIGRAPTADLTLEDEQASREHARVVPDADGATIEDLDSRNGTFLNDGEVHGRVRLHPGDEVLVGVTVLAVRGADDLARRPSAVRAVPPPLAAAERRPDFVSPARGAQAGAVPDLERLVDQRVRNQARLAPLALFVLAVLVVVLYLALR